MVKLRIITFLESYDIFRQKTDKSGATRVPIFHNYGPSNSHRVVVRAIGVEKYMDLHFHEHRVKLKSQLNQLIPISSLHINIRIKNISSFSAKKNIVRKRENTVEGVMIKACMNSANPQWVSVLD